MNSLEKILSMKDGDEVVIGSAVYTRLDTFDGREWKVSPFGLTGDYDKGCYWINSEELIDELFDESASQAVPN